MKSQEEQLIDIERIIGGSAKDYCIKGSTYHIKEELKSWGWFWDYKYSYWKIIGVEENDPCLKRFQEIAKTWIELI